jgi:potassium uptake TrkH family protein
MPSRLFKIREKINLRIFSSKNFVAQAFHVLSFLVLSLVVGVAIYYYGFPKTDSSILFNEGIMELSLIFFSLRYIVFVFYDFHPLNFIKQNRFEGGVLLFFTLYIIFPTFFNKLIFRDLFNDLVNNHSLLLLQLYFVAIIGIELGKSGSKIAALNLKPATLLVLSFVLLIGAGTGLLMLPEMTIQHHFDFLNSLFTATSASCVTGLIVVDTATFFTLKGKLVIMMLIQLGGINIISFATFFATFSKSSGSIKYQSLIKEFLSTERLSDSKNILRSIVEFSLLMEAIGTLLLYFSWGNVHFDSWKTQLFNSVFHAVSAFNNAGFSTFSNNLAQSGVRNLYGLQVIIIFLIFFGGFGFVAMQDVFSIKSIRRRIKNPWRRLNTGTKITLYMSLSLISLGAIVFYFLQKGSMTGDPWYQVAVTSVFQSVTTRTAGFNTVDISRLSVPVLLFFLFLMFVGAGPGSTGGGIKVTTFAVIIKSAIATIKGEKSVVFFKRTLPFSTIDKAYSIALFSLSMIFISTFLLTITEPGVDLLKLFFEEFSAFGTVGLSMGITASLTAAGKAIIITSMFVGRIGTLTMAMAISTRVISTNFRYAETSVMVG